MRPGPGPVRSALLLLALVLAGCSTPPPPAPAGPLLRYAGDACDEVAVLVPVDAAVLNQSLPAGLEAVVREGRGLVGVALNRCAFRAAEAQDTAWEAFAWASVKPPAAWRLAGAATHFHELVHWREAGPSLEALRTALPAAAPAVFEGLGQGLGQDAPFAATVRPGPEGTLRINGTAAAIAQTGQFPPGPCCRIFAPGAAGLVAVDFTSSPQPQGTARCTVRTDLPLLVGLLGAEGSGDCVHNAGYNFTAEVRALPPR